MNLTDLPVPSGAVAGDWNRSEYLEDVYRCLTWSRHDAAGAVVAVQGEQYADGRVERSVVVLPISGDLELSAVAARQLAAALLDAADKMEAHSRPQSS